jgi:phage terminase small subunit
MASSRGKPKSKSKKAKPRKKPKRPDAVRTEPQRPGPVMSAAPAAPAAPLPGENDLTPRQRMFCLEYLRLRFNGARAAIEAGYSADSAKQIAHELLQKPHIKAYLDEAKAEAAERTKVSRDRVVEELARVAFLNMKDIADWKGGRPVLKDAWEVRYEDSAGIKGFSYSQSSSSGSESDSSSESYTFSTHDKVKALELLAKHTGALEARPPSPEDDLKDALDALDVEDRKR